MDTMVSDTTGCLRSGEISRLKREMRVLQRRYPQLVLQIVMHALPTEHPFELYAFWLFNEGAFAGKAKRGSDNHALMILLDPYRCEAAIVPGYGLEPLLKLEWLERVLDMAEPLFGEYRWEDGLQLVLDGLDGMLDSVSVMEDGEEGEF
jgi:uncharacterized membrane protein YgcG